MSAPCPSSLDENIDSLLAHVYDILKCIERESNDTSGKRTEETSTKIMEWHKLLQQLRHDISSLNGIEYCKETQLRKLEAQQEQLKLKRDLLEKYKDILRVETEGKYLGNN